jgi:hypothetical protein
MPGTTTERIKLYGGKVTILLEKGETNGKGWHRFSHLDGTRIMGVTSFTGNWDKPALVPWAAKMMGLYLERHWEVEKIKTENEKLALIATAKKEFQREKEAAAEKGREAHEWVHQWVKGKKLEMPEDEQIRNSVTAFLDWFKNGGVKVKTAERVVYSRKYDYAGILDWSGKDKNGLIIGDYKTGNGIYDEALFQLMLYWQADEEESKTEYKEGHILRFGKDDARFYLTKITRDEYKRFLPGVIAFVEAVRTRELIKWKLKEDAKNDKF